MKITQSYWQWELGLVLAVNGALAITSTNSVLAQNITLDGTLGAAQTLNGPIYVIPQAAGQTVGSNLFHSFGIFNLDAGEISYFQSAGNINNIFARITGGSLSIINGSILTESSNVNLFLINPSGIVFGPNAAINVGGSTRGSFVATTADALVWSNGSQFSATNPGGTNSLLTIIGDPSGFLFSMRPPQPIDVIGSTLSVFEGQSLLLLGGDVNINNGFLLVNFPIGSGRVELGAVAAPGIVGLTTNGNILNLNFPDSLERANVSLDNQTSIYTLGNDQGSIAINARNIDIFGGTTLAAGIFSGFSDVNAQAGDITLNATGAIRIGESSSIQNVIGIDDFGNSGNVNLTADSLLITDGSQVGTTTFGQGNAGNTFINVKGLVNITGTDTVIANTVQPEAIGNSGNIDINAGSISVSNGAQIVTNTSGIGNAGNVFINAKGHINLVDLNSGISSIVSFDTLGNAGNVFIQGDSISISNNAIVSAATFGMGNAGNIFIQAREASFDRGFITSSVLTGAIAKGGNININADSLIANNRTEIASATLGQGDAGSIFINAAQIRLSSSVASSTVSETGVGNGGNVKINADSLLLTNGSQLSASTYGRGNAGSIIIDAKNSVDFDSGSAAFSRVGNSTLQQRGPIIGNGNSILGSASSIFNQLENSTLQRNTAIGNGGDIRITTNTFSLTNGSQLDTSTFGQGDAGDIQINAVDKVNISGISLINGLPIESSLFTFADRNSTGKGGDITVNANSFRLADGALLDARTRNNNTGGDIRVNARLVEALNGGQIITVTSGSGSAGKIEINATERVVVSGIDPTFNARFAQFGDQVGNVDAASGFFVRSDSSGSAGDIEVNSPFLVLDNGGMFSAESASVNGGNITLNIGDLLLLRRGSQISTTAGTAFAGGNGGNININAGFIIAVPKEGSDITANAFSGAGGQVQINTQGIFGIEPRPNLTNLSDITASSETGVNGEIIINTPDVDPSKGLVELTTDTVNTARLVDSGCSAFNGKTGSSFSVTGRGGLPSSPDDTFSGDAVWSDTRLTVAAKPQGTSANQTVIPKKTANTVAIVPANGWVFNNKGEVTLVNQASPTDSYSVVTNQAQCHQR